MIIGLVGSIGCGKGTAAEFLCKEYGFRQDSFAASLKDTCSAIFGWDRHLLEGDTVESRTWRDKVDEWWSVELGINNFTPRYALQTMGTDVIRGGFNQNIWFLSLKNRLRIDPATSVVISDVRFPNEIDFVRNNNGIIVRIVRGGDPSWFPYAISANTGDATAKIKMKELGIHYSEWAWAGSEIDYTIDNSSDIHNLHSSIRNLLDKCN